MIGFQCSLWVPDVYTVCILMVWYTPNYMIWYTPTARPKKQCEFPRVLRQSHLSTLNPNLSGVSLARIVLVNSSVRVLCIPPSLTAMTCSVADGIFGCGPWLLLNHYIIDNVDPRVLHSCSHLFFLCVVSFT